MMAIKNKLPKSIVLELLKKEKEEKATWKVYKPFQKIIINKNLTIIIGILIEVLIPNEVILKTKILTVFLPYNQGIVK